MKNPRAGGSIYIWTLGSQKTAHLVARDFGHDDVFRLLMDRTPPALQLAVACELGDETLVRTLVADHPAVAQTLTDDDRAALADAAESHNIRAVRLMLSAGWPVDARGHHGLTPLHWAAWHGNDGMVVEILKHAPSLEDRANEFNVTPVGAALHGSVHSWHCPKGDYAATVEALLEAGATPPALTDDLEASPAARAALIRSS